MSIDMAQFHQVFFEESFEGLEIMESGLLGMEPGTVDAEEINSIFRAAHSIKGGSGTFGFTNISEFTHILETLLDEMRDGRREVTTEAVNALLASVDVVKDMLEAAQDGGDSDEERAKEQKAELERILANQEAPSASGDSAVPAESTGEAVVVIEEPDPIGWKIVFAPHVHLMRTGNDPLRIIREIADLGEIEVSGDDSTLPSFDEFEPEDFYLSFTLRLMGDIQKSAIDDIFEWVEDDCDFAIIPIMPEGYDPEAAAQAAAAQLEEVPKPEERRESSDRRKNETIAGGGDRRTSSRRKKVEKPAAAATSIRVDTQKIDSLINMVGELVITQSMLGLLGENFDLSKVAKLQEGLAQLERHTREMQESVMQIRMLPISFTFSRFPRLVHDLSTKMGKKIELVMSGENTEVDKTVIEKIGDPLVHLVRNSLDHGIEMPEDRIAAGKPETGTIQLNAFHKGGNIVIEIRDDGKGLNTEVIYNKALDKGLISEDDNLTDNEINEMIFHAGFSTAEVVSDVSGRGVGMDVVRRNINELGGSIKIESKFGEGSAIIVRLPLTLAILDGQSIQIGDETYIIPLVSIIESIQPTHEMINLVAGKGEAFKLRDEYLPVVRMHKAFDIAAPLYEDLTKGILVVVEAEGRKCGLFVDDLLGQQQVVIKSLEANYMNVDGVSGATILGDGSVALIIDIPGLMELAKKEGHLTAEMALTA